MSTLEKQKVWMVLEHPQAMVTALALVKHWGRDRFVFNLLISRHFYFEAIDINQYKNQFDNIIVFDRVDYVPNPFPHPLKIFRILRQKKMVAELKGQPGYVAVSQSVFNSLQNMLLYPLHVLSLIFRILRLKRRVAQLEIQPYDIIIGLSSFYYLENVVLSMHPQNLKIGIMPAVEYDQHVRPVDRSVYKDTLEGWVSNWIIEPVTGLHRTHYMKERRHPALTAWIRFKRPLPSIYNKFVVLGDISQLTGDNILTMPFPYTLTINQAGRNDSNKKRQKVVFFGSNFMGFVAGVIAPEIFAQKLNACLSFVRERYGSTYKLVFRPHPFGKREIRLLDLSQFEVEDDGMLSEFYLYHNIENIHAVFAVESTSSRSAFNFFINAYSFLNIFPYDKEMKSYFRLNYGNVPDDFYINDLSIMPNRYVRTEDIDETRKKCRDVLDAVIRK